MGLFHWIVSLVKMPFLWSRSIPLARPGRIDWNPSLIPRTVDIKGHTLFYVVKGKGAPIVLVHGYGAGIWVWEKQMDILSQHYQVYALDLIGHGYSDRPRMAYTPEVYIRSFRDFMDAVGIDRATLVGNSMGGGVAWAVASFFPEKVAKLILIDSIPPDVLDQVRNDSFRALSAIRKIPLLSYLVFASRNKHSIKRVLQECLADASFITEEVLNRQLRLSEIKGTTWVLYSTLENAKEAVKLENRLSRLPHPTLLIWGEKDLVFPPSVGERLQRMIPGSRLKVIEKSGHIPMWETPEEVNQTLLSFLKE